MRGRSATSDPEWLPGATEFSDDRDLCDPVFVLEAMKQFPDLFAELRAETDLEARLGRKRMEGDWSMVMVAFILSGHVDIEPFCNSFRDSRIWSVAGFKRVPTVQTVWNRLTELEPHAGAFVRAANRLIQKALRFDPEIADNIWVDATGFETHAILEHCCQDRAKCAAAGGRPPKVIKRAGEELIREERHKEAAEAPAPGQQAPDAAEEVPEDQAPEEYSPKGKPYKYFRIGGHDYRSLDHTSGARSYRPRGNRRKAWFGGYSQTAISMRLGAPLAINIFKASDQEHAHYRELYEDVLEATGGVKPMNVVADRGYSVEAVYEWNTRQGGGTVIPYRKPGKAASRDALSTAKVDKHGIPRCKHCGGAGQQSGRSSDGKQSLGFHFDSQGAVPVPRIRFECMIQATPDCKGTQTIACEESWRLLVALPRDQVAYHTLKKASRSQERHFRHWRSRYKVAGSNIDSRPKRPGLDTQRLRAAAALMVEWFRINLRHGWLGSHRNRNTNCPIPFTRNEKALNGLLAARRRSGLDLPYGPAAVRCGLGHADPPKSGSPPGRSRSRPGSKVKIDTGPIPF